MLYFCLTLTEKSTTIYQEECDLVYFLSRLDVVTHACITSYLEDSFGLKATSAKSSQDPISTNKNLGFY
jgi:hypothetical protein